MGNLLQHEETNVPPASQAEQTILYSSRVGAIAQCKDSDEELSHPLQCSNIRRPLHGCRGHPADIEDEKQPAGSGPARRASRPEPGRRKAAEMRRDRVLSGPCDG